jgi:ectoine hydroxylase-related dioxygenase (phytanoyl-CoA dioxygenase family)
MTPHKNFFYPNFLGRDQLFVNLLDWYKTFPKVWGILGWNIYSYHSHLIIMPPRLPEEHNKPKPLGWHQDSGRVNVEMESSPRPRLSLKIVFWLSDCSEPGRGNFYIIPGSHLWDTLDRPSDGALPEDAMSVCCKPGDAVFFDRRLWHARSENDSDITRKGLFYGYGYRWLRSKDDMTIPQELFKNNDPIRQQLLGGGTDANGHFSPKDEDVPLKVWLEEHGII